MKKTGKTRRSVVKGMLLAMGATMILGPKRARARKAVIREQDEILYRETEAFRAYYDSLRNS